MYRLFHSCTIRVKSFMHTLRFAHKKKKKKDYFLIYHRPFPALETMKVAKQICNAFQISEWSKGIPAATLGHKIGGVLEIPHLWFIKKLSLCTKVQDTFQDQPFLPVCSIVYLVACIQSPSGTFSAADHPGLKIPITYALTAILWLLGTLNSHVFFCLLCWLLTASPMLCMNINNFIY